MVLNLTDLGRKLTASRQKNQELSPTARAAIYSAVAAGASQRAITTAFSISHILITNTIKRFTTTASFNSKPRTSQPNTLTRQEKQYIIQLTKHNI